MLLLFVTALTNHWGLEDEIKQLPEKLLAHYPTRACSDYFGLPKTRSGKIREGF